MIEKNELDIKVELGKPVLVHAPIMNEQLKKWGVYAIPRMWRAPTGELVIRFNGESDSSDIETRNILPNLFFVSKDNGKSWIYKEDGEEKYCINHLVMGIGRPYTKLKDGKFISVYAKENCLPIENVNFLKEFPIPQGGTLVRTYHYEDIPEVSKGFSIKTYNSNGEEEKNFESKLNFKEREILVSAYTLREDEIENDRIRLKEKECYKKIPEYIHKSVWDGAYIWGITELFDGDLVAITCGQNPARENYCGDLYLVESKDGGKTWNKRGIIANGVEMQYGYGGDGFESTLTVAKNGDILCAMRMEQSIDPDIETPLCDTMVAISHNNGYTWDTPFSVSDSSVTPQIFTLKNGIIIVVYGRPGVHFKYSADNGKTWSKSYSIIGKTLEEERKTGRSDADIKYFDTSSYSNVFLEEISEDTVIVCYNDMKYPDINGVKTKACFVRTITVTDKKSL